MFLFFHIIQKRAAKIIPELRDFSEEAKPKRMWFNSGLTEVFKILNACENIDRTIFSHSRKIVELDETR